MTSIVLDIETERGLKTLANLTGRSEPDLIHEAVMSYLENIEDVRAAEAAYRKIESGEDRPMSLAELDEYLSRDLDG